MEHGGSIYIPGNTIGFFTIERSSVLHGIGFGKKAEPCTINPADKRLVKAERAFA